VASWTDVPLEATVKQLLTGSATRLSSQFRLSYSMILNLLRVNDLSVEDMIKRSFSEFHTQRQMAGADMKQRLRRAEGLLVRLEREADEEEEEEEEEEEMEGQTQAQAQAQGKKGAGSQRETLEAFQRQFAASQKALRSQLAYLSGPAARRADRLACLGAGRVGWALVEHKHWACWSPSLVVVLADPDATAAAAAAAAGAGPGHGVAGLGIGLGLLGAKAKEGSGSGDDEDEAVWLLVLLPREAAEELAALPPQQPQPQTPASTPGPTSATSSGSGGWQERVAVAPSGEYGFWVTRAPSSCLGMLAQEKIKLPSSASASASAGMGMGSMKGQAQPLSLSTSAPSRSSAAAPPSAADQQVIAAALHAVLARVHNNSALAHVPSLAFLSALGVGDGDLSLSGSGSGSGVQSMALPPLDMPREFRLMGVDSVELQMRAAGLAAGCEALSALLLRSAPSAQRRFQSAHRRARVRTRIAAYRHLASTANLALFPDYQQRLSILRMLEYVERDGDTVTLKGRVACEMNTCDELVAAEMIFGNVLEPLTPPEAAAVLSAFVFQEKSSEDSQRLTSRMELAREQLQDILRVVRDLQDAEGVVVSDELKPSLNFGIAAVVYQWARGMPFKEITAMTLIQEGSIVRCITRLDELLKDVRNAARVIGNPSLYRKMVAASLCVRRDIVFASSLYI